MHKENVMLSSVKSNTQNVANDAKTAARTIGREVEDAADDVGHTVRDVAHRAGQEARRVYQTAKDEFGHATDAVADQIRERPVQSTLLALGVGMLVGAFLSRR
jgi:ElaB/YqjD/DUF883 family membrane-anchored ribosome-binding protein